MSILVTCPRCDGFGLIDVDHPQGNLPRDTPRSRPCPRCGGLEVLDADESGRPPSTIGSRGDERAAVRRDDGRQAPALEGGRPVPGLRGMPDKPGSGICARHRESRNRGNYRRRHVAVTVHLPGPPHHRIREDAESRGESVADWPVAARESSEPEGEGKG